MARTLPCRRESPGKENSKGDQANLQTAADCSKCNGELVALQLMPRRYPPVARSACACTDAVLIPCVQAHLGDALTITCPALRALPWMTVVRRVLQFLPLTTFNFIKLHYVQQRGWYAVRLKY